MVYYIDEMTMTTLIVYDNGVARPKKKTDAQTKSNGTVWNENCIWKKVDRIVN